VKASGSGQRTTQARTAFPNKDAKKKYNPAQLRSHIRAIIHENMEEGSPEYDEFVQEVEEKGF